MWGNEQSSSLQLSALCWIDAMSPCQGDTRIAWVPPETTQPSRNLKLLSDASKSFVDCSTEGKSCSVSLTCVSIPASCRWGQSCLKWWHHSQVGHYVSPLQSDANHCPRLHIHRSFSNVDGLFWALTLPWSFIKSCFSWVIIVSAHCLLLRQQSL